MEDWPHAIEKLVAIPPSNKDKINRGLGRNGWFASGRKKRGILPLELDPSMSALFARLVRLSISLKHICGNRSLAI